MRSSSNLKLFAIVIAIIVLSLACTLPGADGQPQDQNNAQQDNNQQNNEDTQNNNQPEPSETPEVEEETEQDTEEEEEVETQPTEPPTPTPTLAHSSFPTNPGASVWLAEASSQAYAAEGRSIADAFNILQFERPFTSQEMEYQGYLDITRAELSVSSPFVYVTIFLEDIPPAAVNAHYGIEVDADQDGRGDWLVYGLVPAGSDWTVMGVRVYQDSNNDVGGPVPLEADGALTSLDGYDQLLFDQGYETSDPDMAWIRRDPSHNDRVQLAFKYSVIGSAGTFLWGVWADAGPVEPAWFDYNDHYTPAQAGSPLSNSPNYPLNELASVDNTCRWSYGFSPVGDEPGICTVPATPTPSPTPAPGVVRGIMFRDDNYNGVREGSEPGMSGWTVTLGVGACPSSGFASTTTNSSGVYTFNNVPAGTYCVTIDITLATGCAGWHTLTGKSQTITVPAGNTVYPPDMGFANIIC